MSNGDRGLTPPATPRVQPRATYNYSTKSESTRERISANKESAAPDVATHHLSRPMAGQPHNLLIGTAKLSRGSHGAGAQRMSAEQGRVETHPSHSTLDDVVNRIATNPAPDKNVRGLDPAEKRAGPIPTHRKPGPENTNRVSSNAAARPDPHHAPAALLIRLRTPLDNNQTVRRKSHIGKLQASKIRAAERGCETKHHDCAITAAQISQAITGPADPAEISNSKRSLALWPLPALATERNNDGTGIRNGGNRQPRAPMKITNGSEMPRSSGSPAALNRQEPRHIKRKSLGVTR